MAVKGSVPEPGTIVPHLIVRDAASALAFYERAFDAEVLFRAPTPSGAGEHLHLRIAHALVQVSTEDPPRREQFENALLASPERLGGSTCVFQLRVDDIESAYRRAVESGARPMLPPTAMFWGDRYGLVRDPFGQCWAFAQVDEVLTPDVVTERTRAFALPVVGADE